MFDIYEIVMPSWAICAIHYGDYSGLSEKDIADLESFLSELPAGGHFAQVNDDYYFSNNPDFGLPCNVSDYQYLVKKGV